MSLRFQVFQFQDAVEVVNVNVNKHSKHPVMVEVEKQGLCLSHFAISLH